MTPVCTFDYSFNSFSAIGQR